MNVRCILIYIYIYRYIYVIWCKSKMGIYEKGESSLMGRGWENKGSQWCSYLMKAVGKLIYVWTSKMERGEGRVIGGQIKAKSNDTCIWYIWHIRPIHIYDGITVALIFLHSDLNIRTGISGCFYKTLKVIFAESSPLNFHLWNFRV